MPRVPAVLSVDLEFFQHAPAYRSARGSADEAAIGCDGVEFLLDAFDDADAVGTFFIVSEIAETHESLVRRIADAGHEIGSHTHSHRHLTGLSPADRREELATSKGLLADVADTHADDVVGFRAPSFDVPDDLFAALGDLGYEYDSSVVPCRSIPGWYGGEYDTWRPSPASVVDPAAPDGLAEVPVAAMPGLRLPLTGTWIRFFGVRYTLLGMRWLARRGIPPVLYVHPWELVDVPDIEGVPSRIYWRSGEYMRRAVERILATDFDLVTACSLSDEVLAGGEEREDGVNDERDGTNGGEP